MASSHETTWRCQHRATFCGAEPPQTVPKHTVGPGQPPTGSRWGSHDPKCHVCPWVLSRLGGALSSQ